MVMEAIGAFGDVADAMNCVGEPTVAPFAGALVETPAKLSAGKARHSRKRRGIFDNWLSFNWNRDKANVKRPFAHVQTYGSIYSGEIGAFPYTLRIKGRSKVGQFFVTRELWFTSQQVLPAGVNSR